MSRKKSISELFPPHEPIKNPVVERERAERSAKRYAQRREASRHKRNPRDKMRARQIVRNAIGRGDLVPMECQYEYTGCLSWPVEAHHHRGYGDGRELDIKWACKACHDKISVQQRRAGGHREHLKCNYPDRVIHIFGPPLSGKSSVLSHVDSRKIWDVMDFYYRCGAVIPGEPFPPRLRLINPQEYRAKVATMRDDLHSFISGSSGCVFIESSGVVDRINKYLHDNRHNFIVDAIKLDIPSENYIIHRCKLKKWDIVAINERISDWRIQAEAK
ncbi:MAG: hypothetical protein ACXADY_26890, partial [Candidatus Hodarchaeales archaeon]